MKTLQVATRLTYVAIRRRARSIRFRTHTHGSNRQSETMREHVCLTSDSTDRSKPQALARSRMTSRLPLVFLRLSVTGFADICTGIVEEIITLGVGWSSSYVNGSAQDS
jgi:hypothetical protein